MGKIGFLTTEKKKETEIETEAVVVNVDRDFKRMISELELEENMQLKLASLERIVRKELAKIYKKIKKLEKKTIQRNKLEVLVDSYSENFPQKSLDVLNKIEQLNAEILPEAESIRKEISKHMLAEVAEMYKELKLSNEEIKHIRFLANNLSIILSVLARPVYESMRAEQTEQMRRRILMHHPNLK
ncbi:MAG: hypothetical protein AABW48_00805 [Nanoarchaeota archaeon]